MKKNNILPQNENDTIEFKTSFNEDVIVSLVAFCNQRGGSVYVGITDTAEVKGVELNTESVQNWINEIKNKTTPQIIADTEVLNFDGKTVVKFYIPEYPIKPVSVRGRFYKRVNNSNHLMSIDEIANEHLKTINSSWDYYLDPNHSLQAISITKVEKFIAAIEKHTQSNIRLTAIEFLSKMEMIRDEKLTFGGYLLFATDYCLASDVQIGRFKSQITIIDSLSLNTDLISEVDEMIAFIKKHLMIEYIITGEPQRTERFDYPLDAIREIVINMVVHRDYRESSGSIIKIFDDRIEFYNPGKLFGGLTIADLLSGNYTSKSRNKLIARAFKEMGLIERYGSGIARIRNICAEYGVIEPTFKEIAQGFQVVLFKEKIEKSEIVYVNDTINDTINDTLNDPVNDPVNDRQKAIIQLIYNDNYINKELIADKLKISVETIKRDIRKLKKLNIIIRIGSDKTGYWKIISE